MFEFYSYDETAIDSWYEKIKETLYVVRVDLQKEFKRCDRIGKGNFASVYKWKRLSDGHNVAVKSLEKKKIIDAKKKR